MIRSFRDRDTARLFDDRDVPRFRAIERVARRKLLILHRAIGLDDLRSPPGNRLEATATAGGSTVSASTTSGGSAFAGSTAVPRTRRSSTTMPDPDPSGEEGFLAPISPGEILLAEFVRPHGLTLARVARDLGVNAGRAGEIVHGRGRITAEMALRLGRYFGTSAEFWTGLQTEYELRKARRELGPSIEARVRSLQAA